MDTIFPTESGLSIEKLIPILIGAAVFLIILFFHKRFWKQLQLFHRDESGAAYSISFLMVLPFYVAFMCLVMECVFLFVARMGCIHSSFAAARAAAVHTAVNHPLSRKDFITNKAKKEAKRAAILAMIPYSSGKDTKSNDTSEANEYLQAYKDYVAEMNCANPVKDSYVLARYASAAKRVQVELSLVKDSGFKYSKIKDTKYDAKKEPWKQSVKALVTYDMPFRISAIGRVLGGKKKDGKVVLTMQDSTTLLLECPKNKKGFLGVPVPYETLKGK